MNCPHCGKEIEQSVNMLDLADVHGANLHRFNLVFNNAACANPHPSQDLSLNHMALNNANGCNPTSIVTTIKF